MGRGLVGIIPKLHKQILMLNFASFTCTFLTPSESGYRPVLVELDSKVGHVLQGFVGEAHVHVHVTLAARERSRDLQSLGFHGRKPHLVKSATAVSNTKTICSPLSLHPSTAASTLILSLLLILSFFKSYRHGCSALSLCG